ncbi:MAG TPA: methyltransferase [Candidatus Dormibacteraeota bacterium]|jgi:methylase of polypeptide subunit release factors|nr:methyltransferase [Candidatus Dormibacteraeota bacterium]
MPYFVGLASMRLRDDADEQLTVLARLFMGGEVIGRTSAARAVAPARLDSLAKLGLLAIGARGVRSAYSLEPFDGLFVTSDYSHRMAAGHVLGVGGASRTLAALTVRRSVSSALDLCCGSGVQALLAARHAKRVIGVDLNPRCLRLARLNSALNGVANIEWRRGDLFQPVAEEQFDLIVANPPFIVSPVRELLFRDGGREGDELSRDVVVGAGRRLREGGFATVLCSWVGNSPKGWSRTPRKWLKGLGCDAWVIQFASDSAITYAMHWNGRPGRRPATAARLAERWLADYRARGIEAISTGAIVLRRRSGGRNWVRHDELLLGIEGDSGAHVERVFAAQDLLHSLRRAEDLLTAVLAAAPTVRIVERRTSAGVVERARLTVGAGLRLPGPVPAAAIPVLLNLNGRRTLGEAFELAATASGGSAERLIKDCLRPLTELLARGLLMSVA